MRRTLFAIIAFFISVTCYAQVQLEFGKEGPFIDRDTIRIGDTFNVTYWLINRNADSATTYADTIRTYLSTDKSGADSMSSLTAQQVIIPINDSEMVTAPFIATSQFFKEGEPAIVVVWPTGGGTENVAKGKKTVPKIPYVGPVQVMEINSNPNRVRIYPHPVLHSLKLEITGPLILAGLSLTDLQGRNLPQPILMNEYLDLSYLNRGMYILQLRFRDGSVSTFRIIKQ